MRRSPPTGMHDVWTRPIKRAVWRIDLWGSRGSLEQEVALFQSVDIARAAFEAAVAKWPDKHITLRDGARIILSHG